MWRGETRKQYFSLAQRVLTMRFAWNLVVMEKVKDVCWKKTKNKRRFLNSKENCFRLAKGHSRKLEERYLEETEIFEKQRLMEKEEQKYFRADENFKNV